VTFYAQSAMKVALFTSCVLPCLNISSCFKHCRCTNARLGYYSVSPLFDFAAVIFVRARVASLRFVSWPTKRRKVELKR